MDLLIIGLIVGAVWIAVLIFVLAMCKASAHADADEERYLAERGDDVSTQSSAPRCNPAVGAERRSIDDVEREREAERLHIELPKRPRLRLTRLIWTRRHGS